MSQPTTIKIDEVEYVRRDTISAAAETFDGFPYVLVRGKDSGVFVGYMKSRNGQIIELLNMRQLWYWEGAQTCTELAETGTKLPKNCKWPRTIKHGEIFDVIELCYVTTKAKDTFEKVSVWEA